MLLERCNEEIAWLTATQIKGVGSAALNDIYEAYKVDEFLETIKLGNLDKLKWGVARKQKIINYYRENESSIIERARDYQEYCRQKNIGIILPTGDLMNNSLKNCKGVPPILFYRGNINLLRYDVRRAAVIGARRCTRVGKERAIEITTQLTKSGMVTVSGMAKGIDAYAHTASLKAGGATIAVLGNGIDICYPPEHDELMEAIIDHGLVISQFLPGTTPRQYQFPARNKLIAGLSEKIYVVEASRNSGTNTTVKFAMENGIEVVKI